ncbi:hypothetical protein Naga_100617g1, partial [Nannochloropsis gaditana]
MTLKNSSTLQLRRRRKRVINVISIFVYTWPFCGGAFHAWQPRALLYPYSQGPPTKTRPPPKLHASSPIPSSLDDSEVPSRISHLEEAPGISKHPAPRVFRDGASLEGVGRGRTPSSSLPVASGDTALLLPPKKTRHAAWHRNMDISTKRSSPVATKKTPRLGKPAHLPGRPPRAQDGPRTGPRTQQNGTGAGGTAFTLPCHRDINKELLRRGADAEKLLKYADAMGVGMNSVNVATCLNRLSKAWSPRHGPTRPSPAQDPRLRRLLLHTHTCLPECQAAELSIILNGVSKLGLDPGPGFWRTSRDLSLALLPTLDQNAHFVQILNAYSRARFPPGQAWVQAFVLASAPSLPSWTARELASLVNSLGNLRPAGVHCAYLTRLRDAVLACVQGGGMPARELATCLSGFGKMATGPHLPPPSPCAPAFHPGRPLLDAMVEASFPLLETFDPQGLAALINGFVHLRYCPGRR